MDQGEAFFRNYSGHCLLIVGGHLALIFGPGKGDVHIHHRYEFATTVDNCNRFSYVLCHPVQLVGVDTGLHVNIRQQNLMGSSGYVLGRPYTWRCCIWRGAHI